MNDLPCLIVFIDLTVQFYSGQTGEEKKKLVPKKGPFLKQKFDL